MSALTTHTFTEMGLGRAPFRVLSVEDKGKVAGSCDYCCTGIRYYVWISSADGQRSKVGMDCVERAGEKGLVDVVKRERNRLARERAAARRVAEHAAAMQAQRDRNGGLTDWELAQLHAEEAEARRFAALRPAIDLLAPFADKLGELEWSDYAQQLSVRLVRVALDESRFGQWCDHYSKHACGNRRGTKAYKADYQAFKAALSAANETLKQGNTK
jgi:hypothetical protein